MPKKAMIFLVAAILVASMPSVAAAGWKYSSHWQSGYSYYNAGYHQGQYYCAGWYIYEPPAVIYLTQFVPQYIPSAVFSTGQVAAPLTVPNQVAPVAAVAPATAAVPVAAPVAAAGQVVTNPPAATGQRKLSLDERLDRIERILLASGNGKPDTGPPPKVDEDKPKGLLILITRCAGCHEEKVAVEKGKGFVMFKGGDMVDLTAAEQVSVLRQLASGRMPPKEAPPFQEGEGQVVSEYLLETKFKKGVAK